MKYLSRIVAIDTKKTTSSIAASQSEKLGEVQETQIKVMIRNDCECGLT